MERDANDCTVLALPNRNEADQHESHNVSEMLHGETHFFHSTKGRKLDLYPVQTNLGTELRVTKARHLWCEGLVISQPDGS
jgi:hypothetical protein